MKEQHADSEDENVLNEFRADVSADADFFLDELEEESLRDFATLDTYEMPVGLGGSPAAAAAVRWLRRPRARLFLALAAAALALCLCVFCLLSVFLLSLWAFFPASTPRAPRFPPYAPLVLVSLDGFAFDYWQDASNLLPRLRSLARSGVSSPLRPVFPSKTFPNHYSIATGLHPESHGIVDNRFFDPLTGEYFSLEAEVLRQAHWWLGDPLWNVLARAGRLVASAAFPGTTASIGAMPPPPLLLPFDRADSCADRVETALGWARRDRPELILLYCDEVDHQAHRYGPESPEVAEALATVDAAIGRLLDGLAALAAAPNVVVLSDHGAVAVDPVALDLRPVLGETLLGELERVTTWPLLAVRPTGNATKVLGELEQALQPYAEYVVGTRKEELPPRYHYADSERIAPWIGVCREGKQLSVGAPSYHARGAHGYDNELPSMQAFLVAAGPAFRRGVALTREDPVIRNIDVFLMVGKIFGLPMPPNNGSLETISLILNNI